MREKEFSRNKATKIRKTTIFVVAGFFAIIEIIGMIFNNNVVFPILIGMLLLCIPDTIISFIRQDEYRWGDFVMLMVYLTLSIISFFISIF